MAKKKVSKKKPQAKSSFEEEIFEQLRKQRVPFEYEPLELLYRLTKYYRPDIRLPNGLLIELKGEFNKDDRDKMLAVKQESPTTDIRLVFQNDGFINKLSATAKKKRLDIRKKSGKVTREQSTELNKNRMKYSDWCEKYGFKFAIGSIPKDWIYE